MEQIAKAILQVMDEVKSIDKSTTVGSGQNSYKGVADKDVKYIVGQAMHKAGLSILPIGVEAKTNTDRWEVTNQYGTKMRQQVHSEVITKYMLLHKSGESIEIVGYGHGVDSQDKAAGKATTYALKYALLYTFMIPTGFIDDADKEHSDSKEVPPKKKVKKKGVLNELQFETTQTAKPSEISRILKEYDMPDAYRKTLEKLVS